MKSIDRRKSLHVLKDSFQKTYIEGQCRELLACLDDVISITRGFAPVRHNPYFVQRGEIRKTTLPEDRWEEAVYRKWCRRNSEPVYGAWDRIISYQVNLPNRRDDQGWGEIDLIGASDVGLPVVIELKAPDAVDALPKVIVQGVAYAIAIQKAWPHRFRNDWSQVIEPYEMQLDARELKVCPVVCLAPAEFWKRAAPRKPAAKRALRDLAGAFTVRGYPVSFVQLMHEGYQQNGLPKGLRAQALRVFD